MQSGYNTYRHARVGWVGAYVRTDDSSSGAKAGQSHTWHDGKDLVETLFEFVVMSASVSVSEREGRGFSEKFYLVGVGHGGGGGVGGATWVQRGPWIVSTSSKGVVVAVLGLAEFVEEEDDRLQAHHQHDTADEACRVEGGVLVGGGRRRGGIGGCDGGVCGGGRDKDTQSIR